MGCGRFKLSTGEKRRLDVILRLVQRICNLLIY
jgi:hypothetical protein